MLLSLYCTYMLEILYNKVLLCISFQLPVQQHNMDSLTSAILGTFSPWKQANATNHSLMFVQSVVQAQESNGENANNPSQKCVESSAENARGFSLMNITCMSMRNSLTVDHLQDIVKIILLGKEQIEIQLHLSNHGLHPQVGHRNKSSAKTMKAFCENQLAIWN